VRVAAIDVGTNTVRLLVADVRDGEVQPVERGRAITRLGQGVDAGRRLVPEAVVRTVDVIEDFARRAQESGAEAVRIAGTSALRDAADRDAFAALVLERSGSPLEVLPGAEEGRISHLGATLELDDGEYVVCDIGGGSTEVSMRDASVSLDIGSVRLKERCLHTDPPSPDQIDAARSVVDDALGAVGFDVSGTLVGVAGTITTLAAVILGLRTYDHDRVHRSRLSRARVVEWSERLLGMAAADIMALGPVERGRADVLGGGSLILRAVMERWGLDEVLVSERDILDGLVLDLAQRPGPRR
jgi:exopolyphosphatase / guanosine-5'-triphosphate,3'-diphosphate pyrophosphatase